MTGEGASEGQEQSGMLFPRHMGTNMLCISYLREAIVPTCALQ